MAASFTSGEITGVRGYHVKKSYSALSTISRTVAGYVPRIKINSPTRNVCAPYLPAGLRPIHPFPELPLIYYARYPLSLPLPPPPLTPISSASGVARYAQEWNKNRESSRNKVPTRIDDCRGSIGYRSRDPRARVIGTNRIFSFSYVSLSFYLNDRRVSGFEFLFFNLYRPISQFDTYFYEE